MPDAPRRFAVLGHPIGHSRSPAIHQAFAAQCGIDLRYEAVLLPLDGFVAGVQRLREAGLSGCNVTLPFKPEALQLALQRAAQGQGRVSERACLAEAANTLGWDADGSLWADNTDGLGLVRDIEHNAGWPLAGRRLLLLGAGGASSGCLGPLLAARPASVSLWNRNAARAQALVARHAALARQLGVALQCHAGPLDQHPAVDGVLNGTSAALGGQPLDLPNGLLAANPDSLALDMVYGPAAEPFLGWARRLGVAQVRDGLGMLVEQAAEAFALWHGRRPDSAPVLHTLRTAAR